MKNAQAEAEVVEAGGEGTGSENIERQNDHHWRQNDHRLQADLLLMPSNLSAGNAHQTKPYSTLTAQFRVIRSRNRPFLEYFVSTSFST